MRLCATSVAEKLFCAVPKGRLHLSMKKEHKKAREAGRVDADEILPEYDFSHARPNKYASQYPRAVWWWCLSRMWRPCFRVRGKPTRPCAL